MLLYLGGMSFAIKLYSQNVCSITLLKKIICMFFLCRHNDGSLELNNYI